MVFAFAPDRLFTRDDRSDELLLSDERYRLLVSGRVVLFRSCTSPFLPLKSVPRLDLLFLSLYRSELSLLPERGISFSTEDLLLSELRYEWSVLLCGVTSFLDCERLLLTEGCR